MRNLAWGRSPLLQSAFVTGICLSVALLAWFGFRASQEWQRSSSLLVERRADEAASLFVTALGRDMRAVQSDVLVARAWDDFHINQTHDVTTLVASAFARYPYPDVFFAMDATKTPVETIFLLRADRVPTWSPSAATSARHPVKVESHDGIARSIEAGLARDIAAGRQWSVFEARLGPRAHQVVARLDYVDKMNQRLRAVYGFTVDLDWVRTRYYSEISRQVQRISGGTSGLALAIVDEADATVASTSVVPLTAYTSRRSFPVLFIDPRVVALNPPSALPSRTWTVLASGAADPTLISAIDGARWTLILASGAAVTLALGLLLSARAIRAWGGLAELRAEFMSSVTHELKTPVAAIQALAQTFVGGRVARPDAQREYGTLILRETRRLTRLIDNLLAHARITDVADIYTFETLDVELLFREAAVTLSQRLQLADLTLDIHTDADLPPINADPAAMALLLDNLLDNAIRYCGDSRVIRLSGTRVGESVRIGVADDGVGIAPEDVERVVHKFVRGKNAPPGGSGLGLAIVQRIATDHRGKLKIESVLGRGTVVTIDLPAAQEEDGDRVERIRRLA